MGSMLASYWRCDWGACWALIVRLHLRMVLGKARALLTTVPGNRASPCLHYTRRFGV